MAAVLGHDGLVEGEPRFRRDLYAGTARDYDAFRVGYPAEMIDDLHQRAGLSGAGRLLDLACGTGQITFALHSRFRDVWAVDQEAGMIGFARAKAEERAIRNVRWVERPAEELDAPEGSFELVAVGNAFHRLRRQLVAGHARRWLRPGGHAALLWSSSPWRGDAAWQVELAQVIQHWKTAAQTADRIPGDWEQAMADEPNLVVLERSGFEVLGEYHFPTRHEWSIDSLAGNLLSTSFLSRQALGAHAERFVTDLSERLLACEPSGVFPETIEFSYELARRPQ